MRGQHGAISTPPTTMIGSPPHARGALAPQRPGCEDDGITPACAGSTSRNTRTPTTSRDHPRMRGEHCTCPRKFHGAYGSPPHARGARSGEKRAALANGITPACAGSTYHVRSSRPQRRHHPRMRGEHVLIGVYLGVYYGSPPHARGAQPPQTSRHSSLGITPACAGSTPPRSSRRRSAMDHPRMRGEHPAGFVQLVGQAGSPPHARGAPYVKP